MDNPLQWYGGNDKLLALYGTYHYSDIWTYSQAWAAAVRQESGQLLGRLRQEMLQIHLDLYPEDELWRNSFKVKEGL